MICIIDCGSMWLEEIKQNVKDLGYEFRTIKMGDLKGAEPQGFSKIIISGGPTLLSKEDIRTYFEMFGFLKTTRLPVLGICLGHQIIGLIHGAKIEAGTKIKKIESIEILKDNEIFAGIKSPGQFMEAHTEFISLPEKFTLLAESKSCKNEAMKQNKKTIYGVQFHPEVSADSGKQLISNFLKLC